MFRYRLAAAISFGLCLLVLGKPRPQSTSQPQVPPYLDSTWPGSGSFVEAALRRG